MEEEEETMEEDSGAMEEISVEGVEAREVEAMVAVTMEAIKEEGLAREEAEEVLVKVEEAGDKVDLTWDQQPT